MGVGFEGCLAGGVEATEIIKAIGRLKAVSR